MLALVASWAGERKRAELTFDQVLSCVHDERDNYEECEYFLSASCAPLHEFAKPKKRVNRQKEAVPKADGRVHRRKVELVVDAHLVDYCVQVCWTFC